MHVKFVRTIYFVLKYYKEAPYNSLMSMKYMLSVASYI